jgi:ankyrin repeat protein
MAMTSIWDEHHSYLCPIDYGSDLSFKLKPLKQLREALKNGADPNQGPTSSGHHADMRGVNEAVKENSIMKLKALLKAGAAVDQALHEAAREWGRENFIPVLLAAGADIEARGRSDQTPLIAAAESSFGQQAVDLLIRAGAGVDAQDYYGMTSLHYASKNGCSISVEALLKAGANSSVKDHQHRAPLECAREGPVKAILQRQALAARLAQSASEVTQPQQIRRRM